MFSHRKAGKLSSTWLRLPKLAFSEVLTKYVLHISEFLPQEPDSVFVVVDTFLAELQDSNVSPRYARDIVGKLLSIILTISIPELNVTALLAVLLLDTAELEVKGLVICAYGIFFLIAVPTYAATKYQEKFMVENSLSDLNLAIIRLEILMVGSSSERSKQL